MSAEIREEGTSQPDPGQGEAISGTGVLNDVRSLWHELRGLFHAHFQLAALEARRAGESLVSMIVAGVMLAVLLSGAWLGLLAAAVLAMVENDISASHAIALAVAFNLLAALILFAVIRRKSRYLKFPVTQSSLEPIARGQRIAGDP